MNQVLRWVLAHQDQVRRLSLQPSEDIPIPQLSLWRMMTSAFVIFSKTLVRWATQPVHTRHAAVAPCTLHGVQPLLQR